MLIAVGLLSVWLVRDGWKLVILSICLLGAHAGNFLTGWAFYYGYNSAPALVLFSILAGAGLAQLLDSPARTVRLCAIGLGLAVIGYYAQDLVTLERYQVNRYYGSFDSLGVDIPKYQHPVFVYHDEQHTQY